MTPDSTTRFHQILPILKILAFVITTAILVGPVAALAGTIRMTTRAELTTQNGLLRAETEVCNNGNAPAYGVRLSLSAFDATDETVRVERLMAKKCVTFSIARQIPPMKKGSYPVAMVTRYTDHTGYPFSALNCMTVIVNGSQPAELTGRPGALKLADRGVLYWAIENTAHLPRAVTGTLYLPDELTADQRKHHLQLASREDGTLRFDIENRFAPAGAVYPVFCAFEYEDADDHYTLVSRQTITIETRHRWFRKARWWFLLSGCVFFFLFSAILIVGRRWTKQGDDRRLQ